MLLALDNISLSFADRLIFEDVSLSVNAGDRIGLIGANGTGKTTLLNVITKKLTPDMGNVIHSSGVRIGFLEQNSGLERTSTIIEEMRSVFSRLINAERRMNEIHELMASANEREYRELAAEYSRLQTFFETNDGYNIDLKIKRILNGMGFADKAFDMPIAPLSGGEKTRLALSKLLLEEPDVLILDEPTNHLDFATLRWLENYVSGFKSALIVVSHDRYFLDKTVERIWELDDCRITAYRGNYTKYKQLRKEKDLNRAREYEKQTAKIAAMNEYAEKNIARASTSKSAKSRLAQLEHITPIEKPRTTARAPHFDFTFSMPSVKDVLTVSELELSVGNPRTVLCDNVSFDVKRGERIAIVGPNGSGKTTLLNTLINANAYRRGIIKWGKNTLTAFYEQEGTSFNPKNSVLDELWSRYPSLTEGALRNLLGRMLIIGDNVFKKVEVLSGGEKAKLGFAIMQQSQANTLILDEPTNHIDLLSREALEDALKEFEGTIIFVSHDRYFMNALANKVLELNNHKATLYNMRFDEYTELKDMEALAAAEEAEAQKQEKIASTGYRSKKQRAEEVKRRQRISTIEKSIAEKEALKAELSDKMNSGEVSSDYEALNDICAKIEQLSSEIDSLSEEWLLLADE